MSDTILTRLKNNLSFYRFNHSRQVAEEAKKLAYRWEVNPEQAFLAGLVHDYARDLSPERLQSFLPSFLEAEAWQIPSIFHALAGPSIVKKELDICDFRVLRAIRWHATGCEEMTTLDKIVFVADFSEPSREFEAAQEVRKIAEKDLNRAYLLTLKAKLLYLISNQKPVYSASLRAWNKEIGINGRKT